MGRRILITGGAGYLGSHTCVELLNSGHEILVYDNLSNSCTEALDRVKILSNKNLEFVKGDVLDNVYLTDIIREYSPEVVVHFAGLKAVAESVADPIKYYNVNVQGSLNLLKAMTENNCQQIVFSSSATVYGETDHLPYNENHQLSPQNPYGQTKLMIEQVLSDWVLTHSENKAVCLRYFNPVGAHESGLIGESPNGMPNNLMPYIAQVACGQRHKLSIFGDDYSTRDGTGERDYIHVVDLAIAHLKALEKLQSLRPFQVLNIGTGTGTTVKELVSVFERISGKLVPSKILKRRMGDVARSWADPSLAEKLLNFHCTRNIDEMCRDTWRWHSQNPNGYENN